MELATAQRINKLIHAVRVLDNIIDEIEFAKVEIRVGDNITKFNMEDLIDYSTFKRHEEVWIVLDHEDMDVIYDDEGREVDHLSKRLAGSSDPERGGGRDVYSGGEAEHRPRIDERYTYKSAAVPEGIGEASAHEPPRTQPHYG